MVQRFACFGCCISEYDVNMYVGSIRGVLKSFRQILGKRVALMFTKTPATVPSVPKNETQLDSWLASTPPEVGLGASQMPRYLPGAK